MNKGLSDQKVLELLGHLNSEGNVYPPHLLHARREVFVQQASAMAALTGPSGGNGSGSAAGISSGWESFTLGRLVEIALALLLAAGAGITAYLYRDTIADFLSSTLLPKSELTAIPSQDPSSDPSMGSAEEENDLGIRESPLIRTPSSSIVPVTVSGTPAPSLVPGGGRDTGTTEDTKVEGINSEDPAEGQSTPAPNDGSGLHLGQTPKPERTLPPNENSPPDKDDKSSKKEKSP